jgi:sec-independent protein translocase protein TatA
MFNLGAPELLLIFLVVLLLFGGSKLPELARGLGKAIRNFKEEAEASSGRSKRPLSLPLPPHQRRRSLPSSRQRSKVDEMGKFGISRSRTSPLPWEGEGR